MQQVEPAAREVVHRFARRTPGGEGHHAVDQGCAGRPQRRPAAHRMADQDHRYVPGESPQPREGRLRVPGGVAAGAVPAAVPVAHLRDQDVAPARRADDGGCEGPHPQRGQVDQGWRLRPLLAPSVQQQDRGRRCRGGRTEHEGAALAGGLRVPLGPGRHPAARRMRRGGRGKNPLVRAA